MNLEKWHQALQSQQYQHLDAYFSGVGMHIFYQLTNVNQSHFMKLPSDWLERFLVQFDRKRLPAHAFDLGALVGLIERVQQCPHILDDSQKILFDQHLLRELRPYLALTLPLTPQQEKKLLQSFSAAPPILLHAWMEQRDPHHPGLPVLSHLQSKYLAFHGSQNIFSSMQGAQHKAFWIQWLKGGGLEWLAQHHDANALDPTSQQPNHPRIPILHSLDICLLKEMAQQDFPSFQLLLQGTQFWSAHDWDGLAHEIQSIGAQRPFEIAHVWDWVVSFRQTLSPFIPESTIAKIDAFLTLYHQQWKTQQQNYLSQTPHQRHYASLGIDTQTLQKSLCEQSLDLHLLIKITQTRLLSYIHHPHTQNLRRKSSLWNQLMEDLEQDWGSPLTPVQRQWVQTLAVTQLGQPAPLTWVALLCSGPYAQLAPKDLKTLHRDQKKWVRWETPQGGHLDTHIDKTQAKRLWSIFLTHPHREAWLLESSPSPLRIGSFPIL